MEHVLQKYLTKNGNYGMGLILMMANSKFDVAIDLWTDWNLDV